MHRNADIGYPPAIYRSHHARTGRAIPVPKGGYCTAGGLSGLHPIPVHQEEYL